MERYGVLLFYLHLQWSLFIINYFYRWLFWSDWGSNAKIERAGMDGTHREAIASFDVKWPNGLTLDLVSKRLYWVDAKLHTISSCNFDGSQRRLVMFSATWLPHPFSISIFEDSLYWSDWTQKAIIKANKFNGSNITTVTALHMVRYHAFYYKLHENKLLAHKIVGGPIFKPYTLSNNNIMIKTIIRDDVNTVK